MSDISVIEKYFKLSENQKDKFVKLEKLYQDWNSKINVISRKDIDELYVRHVLHSLSISKFIKFKEGTKIIDVGTGGGFPGIPLAIMFPKVQFHLVDSIGKKITVVKEVAAAIGLENLTAEHARAEKQKVKYDFVISRAVTAFPKFVALISKLISQKHNNAKINGIIYLKGGDFKSEIKSFAKKVEIVNISDYFEEDFFETKKIIYLPR
jgi:16S rRNA (guanine527-N7)-methyltransferase